MDVEGGAFTFVRSAWITRLKIQEQATRRDYWTRGRAGLCWALILQLSPRCGVARRLTTALDLP